MYFYCYQKIHKCFGTATTASDTSHKVTASDDWMCRVRVLELFFLVEGRLLTLLWCGTVGHVLIILHPPVLGHALIIYRFCPRLKSFRALKSQNRIRILGPFPLEIFKFSILHLLYIVGVPTLGLGAADTWMMVTNLG